jgi:hypothetical protein
MKLKFFVMLGLCAVSFGLSAGTVTKYSLSEGGRQWARIETENLAFRQLADKSQRIQLSNRPSTAADLALTFEQSNEWLSSHYTLAAASAQVNAAQVQSRSGSFSGAFHGSDPLIFEPRQGSLFTGEPGDFVIDFWVYPTRLSDGEQLFLYQAEITLNNKVVEQSISSSFEEGHLVWRFENIFLSAFGEPLTVELHSSFMFKNTWRRHTLRYVSDLGLIELLDDGKVVEVAYANKKNAEDNEQFLPAWRQARKRLLTIGTFAGYLDDFVIYSHYVDQLDFGRFASKGSLITPAVDMDGAVFKGAELIGQTPDSSQFRVYVRFGAYRPELEDETASWQIYDENAVYTEEQKRFVQFKIDFFAGSAANSSPVLEDLIIYKELIPPPPRPGQVSFQRQDRGVLITWQPILGADIAGYKIYFGESPGEYFATVGGSSSPIDVGQATSFYLEGLEPGKLYYFTITAYDSNARRQESAFAPEQSFLP